MTSAEVASLTGTASQMFSGTATINGATRPVLYIKPFSREGSSQQNPLNLTAVANPGGQWPTKNPVTKADFTGEACYPKWSIANWNGGAIANADSIFFPSASNPRPTATLKATSGEFKITASCGNSKEVYVKVVNPTTSVDFQPLPPGSWPASWRAKGDEPPQKSLMASGTNGWHPIRLILGADAGGLPNKSVTLTIRGKEEKSFAVFSDAACTQVFMAPGQTTKTFTFPANQTSQTYYFVGLKGDEEVDAKLDFSSGSLSVDDPGEDKVEILPLCQACQNGLCLPGEGNYAMNENGIDADFPLGSEDYGSGRASVRLRAPEISWDMLDKDHFRVQSSPGVNVTYDPEGYPTQVTSGGEKTTFAYTRGAVEDSASITRIVMKHYVGGAATPHAETELKLDLSSTVPQLINGFKVTSTVGSIVRNYYWRQLTIAYPEFSSSALPTFQLFTWSGTGAQPTGLAPEWMSWSESGDTRIEHHLKGIGAQTGIYTKITRKKIAGIYRVTEINEVGLRKTTFAYDLQGRLTQKIAPDGTRYSYSYPGTARDSYTETETRGTLTTRRTYSTTVSGSKIIQDITTTVNNTLTAHDRYESYYISSSSPDLQIRYDGSTELKTEIYRITDTASPFLGRTRLIKHPDGRVTIYEYSRAANGNDTVTVSSGAPNNPNTPTAVSSGERTVTVTNPQGKVISRTQYISDPFISPTLYRKVGEETNTLDSFGRITATTYLDGTSSSRTYGCCGVTEETDRTGVTTTYGYDELTKQMTFTERNGITTLYSYDNCGRQTAVTVKGRSGGELTTTVGYLYNAVSTVTDPKRFTTRYSHNYAQTNSSTLTLTETVTLPNNATQISTYVNGLQTSTGGTGQHAQTFSYGPNWQSSTPSNVKIYTDMLGRQYKTEYPDGTSAVNYYNMKGQLVKSVTPGGVTALYTYNVRGQLVSEIVDMDRNGTQSTGDIVTTYTHSFGTKTLDGQSVTVQVMTVAASSGTNSVEVRKTEQTLDGLCSWVTEFGKTAFSRTEYPGDGVVRVTEIDAVGVKKVTTQENGLVTKEELFNSDGTAGNVTTYTYDQFDRLSTMTEKRGATVVNTLANNSYDANGNVLMRTVNGQSVSMAYDNLNRLYNYLLPGNRIVNYEFHPTGELKKVSGAETYTQEFSYNNFGGMLTLKTWRTNTTPQVTSWNYDSRQRVKEKIYADGRKVSYTYTADNQPLKRTWARGVTTTYSYDNGGRQTGIDYSDATPDVSITYDFLSRPVTVTDGAGTRTYTYDNAKNVLTAETLPYLADTTLNYTYDVYGRRTGQALKTGSTTHQQANYTYGTDGRYATISDGGYTAHYTHNAAGQLSTLRLATATANQTVSTATRSFDSAHRLTGVSTTAGSLTKNYGYTLNIKDQRIKTTLADGSYWDYAYDNYGQVINAVRKNASGGIAGQSFNYSFDQVGNRQSAFQGTTGSDSQWSYTVNAVNQYSLITEPNGTTYAQVHDADGNLTGSYTTQYTYDAENRLKTADVGTYRYEYTYDYLSRRIRQKVILKSGATGQTQSEVAYVYDGWNVVGVYDTTTATPTFQKGYLWGEDLSGSLQGAGGVGGLLAEKRGGQTYLPVYDGNGNIMSYLNASTKASVAEYVYDAFGRTISSSGAEADNFTYRFSTKPMDGNGLYYYGYRYYDPQHGRWISRDPIEENGGVNLYGFVGNNPVKKKEYLGLDVWVESTTAVDGWHKRICVTVWKEGTSELYGPELTCCGNDGKKYIPVDAYCISFGIIEGETMGSSGGSFVDGGIFDFDSGRENGSISVAEPHLKVSIPLPPGFEGPTDEGNGRIYEDIEARGKKRYQFTYTDCNEDFAILEYMKLLVGLRAEYSIFGQNCRDFSDILFDYLISEKRK
ncbi:RHS repeat domain-containing protein [Victivallis sp. Marseille-Q1083]|uniref:RHS repeat domain-containing protein n=1 Tax=Victivallis sp. Marseille-Q1083 TaxID=2717288 RepID=UPI00158C8ACB|nr:RHS repeat protein [Victivallis sp. Marseille-Q1083]